DVGPRRLCCWELQPEESPGGERRKQWQPEIAKLVVLKEKKGWASWGKDAGCIPAGIFANCKR
ncbi:hypothetical protein KAU04_05930, partial [bacterium]|nr:hypothetical protein [bacterium]